MSAQNIQAKMNGNLCSLVIACGLWQLHLFICSVEKKTLRGYFAMSSGYQMNKQQW